MLLDSLTVAAVLLAWCGLTKVTPPEGAIVSTLLMAAVTGLAWLRLAQRRTADANRRLTAGHWWGADAALRHLATPLALGGAIALCLWAWLRAEASVKLDGVGSLLVLLVVTATAAKFAAETYLYAQLGGPDSPRSRTAESLNTRRVWPVRMRYALGALGGIILPLGAQILAGGAKNIPAVVDAGPPLAMACLALLCLLPAETLERRLFWREPGTA